jgi:hypothetical protein
MKRKSPKQPQPAADPAPAKRKAPPIKNPLPPDAVRKMREFYKESYEIERQWWRINY